MKNSYLCIRLKFTKFSLKNRYGNFVCWTGIINDWTDFFRNVSRSKKTNYYMRLSFLLLLIFVTLDVSNAQNVKKQVKNILSYYYTKMNNHNRHQKSLHIACNLLKTWNISPSLAFRYVVQQCQSQPFAGLTSAREKKLCVMEFSFQV